MDSTQITATFQGEHGSLGFRENEEYSLTLTTKCNGSVEISHAREGNIIPYQNCIYGSMRAFLQNWKNINLYK